MNRRIAALFAAVMVAGVSGATEVVSGDTASLLAAIESANPGETVLVPEGTYELTAQLEVTKGITLKASGAVEATVLKRVGTSSATTGRIVERVLYVNNSDAVVQGFTITGGRFFASVAGDDNLNGAGVLIDTDGGSLVNCFVSGNTGGTGSGGVGYASGIGVAAYGGTLSGCTIANNTVCAGNSTLGTPGVYARDVTIMDCTITNNLASPPDGGAYSFGGGIRCVKNVTVNRCIVCDNVHRGSEYGASGGGGIAIEGTGCVIANTLIARNTTLNGQGGGIHAKAACTILNCTVVGNIAKKKYDTMSCGGIYANDAGVKVYNTIVSGNTSVGSGNGEPEWNGNVNAEFVNCLCPLAFTAGSTGCKLGTPTFDNTVAFGYPVGTSDSVDKGLTDVVSGEFARLMTADLRGRDRVANDIIDIGCYEYQLPQFEVAISMSGEKQIPCETLTFNAVVNTKLVGERTYRWKIDDGAWSELSPDSTLRMRLRLQGRIMFKWRSL